MRCSPWGHKEPDTTERLNNIVWCMTCISKDLLRKEKC